MIGCGRANAIGAFFGFLIFVIGAGGCTSDKPSRYDIHESYRVRDPQFARVMGNLLGAPLVPGNACTTLLNGKEIFPAMLDSIRGAQKSIDMETYIYWSGTIGQEFTDALSERARSGVKVHVMMDWLGSDRINWQYLKSMREAGVQVVEYHPFHIWDPSTWRQLNARTHRKLLIVDGNTGFTGGVGIADEWRGDGNQPDHWRDNHYRIRGPAVAQLQAAFMDNWMKTTGDVFVGEDYFCPLGSSGELWAQVFKSSSQGGSETMQLMMLLSIAAAEKNIRMESAYFVPDALTKQYLLAARKRGVHIEVIIPGAKIDEKVVRAASRAGWGDLLQAGIEIYEFQPAMFHCKQMIVDDLWVSIGSANLDNRSFRINDEANVNLLNAEFARGQIRVFDADKQKARQVSYEKWRHRPLSEKISEHLASVLDGLL